MLKTFKKFGACVRWLVIRSNERTSPCEGSIHGFCAQHDCQAVQEMDMQKCKYFFFCKIPLPKHTLNCIFIRFFLMFGLLEWR